MQSILFLLLTLACGSWAFWEIRQGTICSGVLDSEGNSSRLEVASFDGNTLKVTKQQKTLLSQWNHNLTDECKFQLTAVTMETPDGLQYVELHFAMGLHPKKAHQPARVWIMGNNLTHFYSRGWGSRGRVLERVPAIQMSIYGGALNYMFYDGINNVQALKIRTDPCAYGVTWIPASRTWMFYKGPHESGQEGFEKGLCGNLDQDPDNDLQACPARDGTVPPIPDGLSEDEVWEFISDSCKIRRH